MKSFKKLFQDIKKTHEYRVEKTKLEFVRSISRLMKSNSIISSDLAVKMNTSNAYISKALRGDTNFTIDSMVKLSHAVGGQLHIHIADASASVRWFELHTNREKNDQIDAASEIHELTASKNAIDVKKFFSECKNEERRIFA